MANQAVHHRRRDFVVETCGGWIRGFAVGNVRRFRGVPYAAPTGGANRFQAPKPFAWSGVRDAKEPGPRSPQNEPAADLPHLTWLRDTTPCAEDCLALNVFTLSTDDGAARPVMVYFHGGGFSIGSAGAPGVDGTNLAAQDVVVVTVNHRLNLFGHLYLGGADSDLFADSGNCGVLDTVEALKWVQRNIARFGGDPGNVTIFGQSGGGSKVAVLMAMPQAQGLFHKAIIQSASSLLAMATLDEAERNTHHFLNVLGLHRSRVRALLDMPAAHLLRAMPLAIRDAGGVDNFRPVVDGRLLPCQPFRWAAETCSDRIPLLMGWCETEQRLAFASSPAIYAQGAAQVIRSLATAIGISKVRAAEVFDAYSKGRPRATPGDLHAQILGDHRYRQNLTRAAELHLSHGGSSLYMYLLKWKTPVLDGLLMTPHTMCLAFAFANVDKAVGITGDDGSRHLLQQQMSAAWVAFARSGNPQTTVLPAWDPYSLLHRQTMVFDRESQQASDPLGEERKQLESLPAYMPAIAEGRKRSS